MFWIGCIVGVPTSVLYAMSATGGHPWGLTVHSLLYAVSTLPMALAYTTGLCLLMLRCPRLPLFRLLAKPGRMALTNYIGQSIVGIILYYGIGFGLGLSMGLWQVELTAIAIFIGQIAGSHIWMRRFKYGPLEWWSGYGACSPTDAGLVFVRDKHQHDKFFSKGLSMEVI